MKIVSLNVSLIKDIQWNGKVVKTGIYKEPTINSLEVKGVNIVGDDQADRKSHGGINKSIYAYSMEHYDYWRKQYPLKELPFGMFGENLTTEGLFEWNVNIGDTFKIGTAELIAVQPRIPCFKLGIRFNDPHILKQFLRAPYCGIYFRIKKEGVMKAGDEIQLIHHDPHDISILDLYSILKGPGEKKTILKALELEYLPEKLRKSFSVSLEI